MTHCILISSDCFFFACHLHVSPPSLVQSSVIVYYNRPQWSPHRKLSDKQNTLTQKRGFYHMKGREKKKEREKRETDKVRTDRGAGMGRKCAEWRMHVGERVKERGKRVCGGRDGEDKGRAVFPDVVSVRCSSQLLLRGLLHLHFNLKIAPVIIYLAWARHSALCFLRIDFSLSESLWDSSSLFSPFSIAMIFFLSPIP